LADVERFEYALQAAMAKKRTEGERAPSLGVLGLNDCAAWAHRLRELIADQEVAAERLFRPEKASESVPFDFGNDPENAPTVGVGDTMLQKFGGSASGYHGATVVANDSQTIVTLEGHVEKNLESPVFHFYDGGLPGFVDANNEGETYREANF